MDRPKNSRADWSNYWQGRAAGATGEVFAGVGIETSSELATFWQDALRGIEDGDRVLDLACGAGSALRHADPPGGALLLGLDISEAALGTARESVPAMRGLVASADRLPLANASLDRVISQFGFEYADNGIVAPEIARVLRPGGRFTAIAHMQGGAIARECEGTLGRLDLIASSRFIPASKTFFAAVFRYTRAPDADAAAALQQAKEAVTQAQAAMAPAVQAGGIAAHLQAGARQLHDRRRAYLLEDITGWLDGMATEIAAYRGRMQGMLAAALTEAQGRAVVDAIDPGGGGRVAPFLLGGQPAAYMLDVVCPASSAIQRA